MSIAAMRLREGKEPVVEIASALGYENPSKFSAAFHAVTGMTPEAYRLSEGHNENFMSR